MPRWSVAEQGSALWIKERLGLLTGSKMAVAMDINSKGKESAAREKYKYDLVAERMTDMATDFYVNAAMQWGTEHEAEARAAYEAATGNIVQLCGLAHHDEIDFFAASPDGLIGHEGLVEFKCPQSNTFVRYLLEGKVVEQYIPQMLAQLAVTKRKWCDFCAYDPRMPEGNQLFIRRFEPTAEQIAEVEQAAIIFLDEVDEIFTKITMSEF